MKLKMTCPYCLVEQQAKVGDTVYLTVDSIELCTKYYYEYTCPNGHKNSFFLSNPRYELLYDMGISAYLDGYYREAALDFAACIERFYEYCIFTLTFHWDAINELSDMWKEMAVYSERQYGAFVALHFSKLGFSPPKPTKSHIEFRNNVTHKGHFPTKEETYHYAEYVASRISSIKSNLPTEIEQYWGGMFPALKEVHESRAEAGGHNICTVLSLMDQGIPLDKAIEEFKKIFHIFYEK